MPWVFTTRVDDVFYLPKLIALWGVLGLLVWLLVANALRGGAAAGVGFLRFVDGPIAVFVGLNLLALAFSTNRHQSLFGEQLQHQGVLTTFLYLAFFYAARMLVSDHRRISWLLGAIAAGAVGVSLYAIAQRAGLDPIWKGYSPSGRVFSTIGQPNALAAYLVLALPLTATFLLSTRRRSRLIALGALAAMGVALVLTYSRGGYLGLVAAAVPMVVYGLRYRTHLAGRTIGLLAGGALLVIGLSVVAVAPARSVVTSAWNRAWSVSSVSNDQSIRNHLETWKVAVRIIEAHPVLGTGPETFPDQFPRYSRLVLPAAEVRYFDQFRVESPHDEVLAIASGAGIGAALAYLAALSGVLVLLWRGIRSVAGPPVRLILVAVLAAGLGHFVTDSFMSAEVTGSWLFWTVMGAGVGLAASVPRQTSRRQGDLVGASTAARAPAAPGLRPRLRLDHRPGWC